MSQPIDHNLKKLESYEDLQQYCMTFAGAMEDYPFGPTPLVMKVAGKMFALISPADTDSHPSISIKCDPFINELLRAQYAAVKPGYHLNKKHWITVEVDGSIPNDELKDMIRSSYQLVVNKLPKAQREALLQS